MSVESESATQQSDHVLNDEERTVCQNIAQSGEGLNKQRAAALLALDNGASRAKAGDLSGLTRGQVRYLLETFRQKRLEMLATEVLMETEAQPQTKETPLEMKEAGVEEVKVEKTPATIEIKKGKKKKQKKEKKLKAKGKKMAKKEKKSKKKEMAKSKAKKGKAKGDKKGNGKATKKKAKK